MFELGDTVQVCGYKHDPADGKDPNGTEGVVVDVGKDLYVVLMPFSSGGSSLQWIFYENELVSTKNSS